MINSLNKLKYTFSKFLDEFVNMNKIDFDQLPDINY